MELIFTVLLLGPFVAKLLNERDNAATLGFALGNMAALGVWASFFSLLPKALGQSMAMLIGWVGLLAIQALFFWWAMDGTKWRKSIEASRKKVGR